MPPLSNGRGKLGSSSGKTFAIIALLINEAASNKNLSISIVSESMPHLKKGAMKDFIDIMKQTNRYRDQHFNRTDFKYVFSTGSYIEFFSVDQPSKLRGARRHILYLNEANNIDYEAYTELSIRTEGDIYIDFNPTRLFWAHTDVLTEPDSEMIILTYHDNEGLNKNIIDDFKIKREKAKTSDYWKNWCKVYIDGEVGSLEGAVYKNWKIINTIPVEATLVGLGLDFGFSIDPTAVIAVYYLDGDLILDEVIYETNLTNPDIANRLKILGYTSEVWCDSAEPKSVQELRSLGIRAHSVSKGRDSVNWGISVVQQFNLKITSRSINLINELENYIWSKRGGEKINTPIDKWNHGCDAMRYFIMTKYGKKRNTSRVPFVMGSR